MRERPAISIRTRLVLAFAAIFALCVAITLWSIYVLSEVQMKLHFLEVSGTYMGEIQQARRFEKNYLLYGTNLADALDHLTEAERTLHENGATIEKILGPRDYRTMAAHLAGYHKLLQRLAEAGEPALKTEIEPALREHGAQMVSFALDFAQKERESVEKMLSLARRVPFYFLGVLLLSMAVIGYFLTRQIMGALARFMEYTERVGNGDFTPITPQRKYRDEFSQLAMAFNRMIHELDRRHRILVESHKLRAVGTLVAGVAHELNNPLNNTMLTATLLEEDFSALPDEEKLTMIRDVIGETERSQKIVRNLLDFARESETRVVPLKLDRIIENSIRLVANQVKLAKITLRVDLARDLPPVHGDEQMLQQVFINLILNAVDVLPQRGTINITTAKGGDDGYVEVEVADNGPGIPDHVLSRIFEPFFTTKHKGKGTGLGLSVSQGIVRRLGGYIRVQSRVGEGTAFTVCLPATNVPSVTAAGSSPLPGGSTT